MKEESNGINITSELACADSQYIPPGRPLDPNNRTICSLEDVCGMGGFNNKLPNQWWRFFTAMFIHSGLIHIGLNFSFQLRTGLQMEREMGSLRIAVIYMCSGVGGFIFSGIFSGGAPSVGCSGAIYGKSSG